MKNEIVDNLLIYFSKELNQNIGDINKYPYETKRKVLRGLINTRPAQPISNDILKQEDKLLQLELKEKNIIDVSKFKDKITVWQGDITTLKVDAIVNACNEYLLGCFIPNHACIDNQIHTYAGIRLRLECNDLMQGKTLSTGKVILTKGYNLPSKYIIQTVGPQISSKEVTNNDRNKLRDCYYNSLLLADKNNIKSIVFPCISTGVYGYPNEDAALVAISTIKEYLSSNDSNIEKIVFNVFKDKDLNIYKTILKEGDT